jgi:uncharacterized membrane protein YoaK (UPF0700 family)
MTDASFGLIRIRNGLLLALACTAGYIDALSYLGLGHVFTANMTGNTVLLGIAVAQLDSQAALRAGLALAGFLAGAVIATWIVERDQSASVWPVTVTVALAFELLILAAFAGGWQLAGAALPAATATAILIVLSALAMGMQSAAIHRLKVSGVATTYITGTLTNFVVQLMGRVRHHRSRSGLRRSDQPLPATQGTSLLAAVWIVCVGGAGVAAAGALLSDVVILMLPVLLIMLVVLIAAVAFRQR